MYSILQGLQGNMWIILTIIWKRHLIQNRNIECALLNYNMVQLGTNQGGRGHFAPQLQSRCLWSWEARAVRESNCVAAGLLRSLGTQLLATLHVWNPLHRYVIMWFQEDSPSERKFLVWGMVLVWSIETNKQENAKARANLAKEKFGGSCISAEVKHIGVYIDLYSVS